MAAVYESIARQPQQILLVEDDHAIGAAVCEGLQREGYSTCWARDGAEGLCRLQQEKPQAMILDWMLPKQDGITLLQRARASGIACPTLFLTARQEVEDRVTGLEVGADDYLCKPFAFAELLARVRVLLRRQVFLPELSCGDLHVDTIERVVTRAGTRIDLTGREYALLEFFLRHKGEAVSREMIAVEVWKVSQRATPLDNVIDVQVARLRRKLESPNPTRLLHTLRGVGFCMSEREPW